MKLSVVQHCKLEKSKSIWGAHVRVTTQPNFTSSATYCVSARIVTNFEMNYYGKMYFSLGMTKGPGNSDEAL